MKWFLGISIVGFSLIAALVFGAASATEKFRKSDDKLFIHWPDLAVDEDAETEYGVYAIIQTGGGNLPVIYVITGNFKGKVFVLGSARCDKEFTVLKSVTRGLRDIRCVRQDVFGRKTTTTLQYGQDGLYKEIY